MLSLTREWPQESRAHDYAPVHPRVEAAGVVESPGHIKGHLTRLAFVEPPSVEAALLSRGGMRRAIVVGPNHNGSTRDIQGSGLEAEAFDLHLAPAARRSGRLRPAAAHHSIHAVHHVAHVVSHIAAGDGIIGPQSGENDDEEGRDSADEGEDGEKTLI